MKSHEKRAIERAVDVVMDKYYLTSNRANDYPPEGQKAMNLAIEAVKLAMLRAGRLYDDQTQDQALEYARKLCEPYDWKQDWYHKSINTTTGWKMYVFESHEAQQGSRCRREICADFLNEATAKLSPPSW